MNFQELFPKIYANQNLTLQESKQALLSIMEEDWSPAQTSSFLSVLHVKRETAEELAGFALAMREKAVRVPVNGLESVDTCGTGGDNKGSFNISTIVALVLAACGVPVVKHGNRAASSACGSADLLGALGIRYRLHPEEAAEAATSIGFAFLFAPDYHPATKSVVAIRKMLGVPTIFNYLGPLTNPADPPLQLIGVYHKDAVDLMASALRHCSPAKRALFVHSLDGWDEATPCSRFLLQESNGRPMVTTAETFGFSSCAPEKLSGGSIAENAEIALSILNGERGARRDTVVLNAVLAYRLCNPARAVEEARAEVENAIDSGAAQDILQRLRRRFPRKDEDPS